MMVPEAARLDLKRTELESGYLDMAVCSFIDLRCVFGEVTFLLWAVAIAGKIKVLV